MHINAHSDTTNTGALGRTLSQTRAGSTMSFEYDAVGNRTKRTDYANRVIINSGARPTFLTTCIAVPGCFRIATRYGRPGESSQN